MPSLAILSNLMVNTTSKLKEEDTAEPMENSIQAQHKQSLPAGITSLDSKMHFSQGNNNNISSYVRQTSPQLASTALEQYRLHLYNYALNIERLRCPQYSAAAMAAAAAYASGSGPNMAPPNPVGHHPNGSHYLPQHAAASNRLAALSLFPHRIFQPEEPKPQHSYIGLIAMAILSSAEQKLVLSDIYQYILDNYPYFRARGPGWRNSIRHNLSLNDCFIKSGRSANGKGHYWAIHPANMDDFRKGDFRRRKAQRKVRKHMGLSVDDAGTDSPSPPPLDLTSPPPPTGPHVAMQQLAAFGYPYQHNYIGQFFGRNVIANGGGGLGQYATLQRIQNQQTQLQPDILPPQHPNSQRQADEPTENLQLDTTPSRVAFINSTTTTTIANLYSQTRKRQFDMASLLAPDVHLIENGNHNEIEKANSRTTTTTQTHHTVITKVSVQQHRELLVDLVDGDQEVDADIDVVDASDADEDDLDCGQIDETNNFPCSSENHVYLNEPRRSSPEAEFGDEMNHHQPESPLLPPGSRSPPLAVAAVIREGSTAYAASLSSSNNSSQHDSNSIEDECPVPIVNSSECPESATPPLAQHTETHIELSHMDPHIFRRYYGSYMAAAAHRINFGSLHSQTPSILMHQQRKSSPQ